LSHTHFEKIIGLDLRQQDDVTIGDQLRAGRDSSN